MAKSKQEPTDISSEKRKMPFQENFKSLGQEHIQDVEGFGFMQDQCISEQKPDSPMLDLRFTKNKVKYDGSSMSPRRLEEILNLEKIPKSVPSPEDFSSLVRKDDAGARKMKESGSKSIELMAPILKSKRNVAYVSADQNKGPEKVLEVETFETAVSNFSADSKKKRTDALFDMLVGTEEKTYATCF